MKKYIFFLLSILLVFGCSLKFSEIQKEKMDYIRSAIICDSKSSKFEIVNKDELAEFFSSTQHDVIYVKYKYNKVRKGEITIDRININDVSVYHIDFKRKTFPYSECRKLKTGVKLF